MFVVFECMGVHVCTGVVVAVVCLCECVGACVRCLGLSLLFMPVVCACMGVCVYCLRFFVCVNVWARVWGLSALLLFMCVVLDVWACVSRMRMLWFWFVCEVMWARVFVVLVFSCCLCVCL